MDGKPVLGQEPHVVCDAIELLHDHLAPRTVRPITQLKVRTARADVEVNLNLDVRWPVGWNSQFSLIIVKAPLLLPLLLSRKAAARAY